MNKVYWPQWGIEMKEGTVVKLRTCREYFVVLSVKDNRYTKIMGYDYKEAKAYLAWTNIFINNVEWYIP